MADEDGHPVEELTVFAVLGAGFVALFLGVEWFWLVWVLGFAVVLPSISIVTNAYSTDGDPSEEDDDPLEALRERYASGELTEAEFERKLERLLETEDRETARELRVGNDRADADRDRTERDPEFET